MLYITRITSHVDLIVFAAIPHPDQDQLPVGDISKILQLTSAIQTKNLLRFRMHVCPAMAETQGHPDDK